MIKARQIVSVLFSVMLIPVSVFTSAQVVDLSGCRAIEDRLQRFDCYESLGAADTVSNQREGSSQSIPVQPGLSDSRPAVAQPVDREQPSPPADPVVARSQGIDRFGTKPAADSGELIEGKDGKTELVDTVASVEQRLPTLALITLKNGQKWLQVINKRYPLKAGDEVRIYPSSFGKAYRLTAPRISGFIQVERIQ